MRTVTSIRRQDKENLAIFSEIYSQGPYRQQRQVEPAVKDPRDKPDRETRDFARNREENEK